MNSADVSSNSGAKRTGAIRIEPLSVALIGPDEKRRSAVSGALAETGLARVREFHTYPPKPDQVQRLPKTFSVIVIDADSSPAAALELVKTARSSGAATIMVYSEKPDQSLAVRFMRAGALEYLLLPLKQDDVTEALVRVAAKTNEEAAAPSHESTLPAVTWLTPAPITYGERLGAAQLNATASVAGNFVYTPGPGYVLPVGTHTLWVTFTPAGSDGSAPLQTAVQITVTRATPALIWPVPQEIAFGTVLDDTQLNASAPVAGRFEYTPGPGEALSPGMHTLSVTFTPADGAKYLPAQAAVPITVVKATCPIEWPAPGAITYGAQLGSAQLCATAAAPGAFEYTPASGALLAAGEHRLSVVFTPADDSGYASSQAAVPLSVAKATPVIAWAAPAPIAHGTALSAAQLNATAAIPGSFAYSPAAGEVLSPGEHKLTVIFTPADALNYTEARAAVTLTVIEKKPVRIHWPAPAAIAYGTVLGGAQLNATASVPGEFVYTPAAGHVLAPGRHTLTATFTPSDVEKYASAQTAVVLEVEGMQDTRSSLDIPTETPETPETHEPAMSHAELTDLIAEITREPAAAKPGPRETRIYKGAVYEKGADGKWHLQRN